MKKSPVIIVIGAGAIGGIVASILKKAGFDVTVVSKHPELAESISNDGIEVSGTCGLMKVKIPAVASVTEIVKMPDYVLIGTKAHDLASAAKDVLPLLPDDSLVVSLQNGIVEEELANIVGKKRAVGCVVGWGATMHSRNVLEMTSRGEFVIGYLDRKPNKKLERLAEILSEVIHTDTTDTILNHLYSKLIINSCITTVGAICGLPLGKMLSQTLYRKLFLDIIKEAIDVARAMELEVPDYAGKLNYYKLLEWSNFRKHLFLRLFGFKYRRLKSSSLQSLERGKKTEVMYFNGYIAEKGKQYGIKTPVNERMTRLIKEIEDGKRKISVENLS